MANIDFTDVETTRAGCSGGTFPPEEIPKIIRGWNSRVALQGIEELAHEIARDGQISLVDVRKGEGGKPELVSGNRRTAAIEHINANIAFFMEYYPRLKGPIGLKFQFVSINAKDARIRNVKENTKRLALSPIDQAHVVHDFREMGYKDQEIADALGVVRGNPTPYLDELAGYLALDQETQDALHAGEISRSLVSELRDLPAAEAREVVKKVKESKASKKEKEDGGKGEYSSKGKGKGKGGGASAQAVREIRQSKRERGVKTGYLTIQEILEALDSPAHDENGEPWKDSAGEILSCAEAYNLGNDLQTYITGQWTEPFELILSAYDRDLENPDMEEGEGEGEGEYVMEGGVAKPAHPVIATATPSAYDDLSSLLSGARDLIHELREPIPDMAKVGNLADMLELYCDEIEGDRKVAHALAAKLNGAAGSGARVGK